jgi:hypothetical protein
MPFSLRHRFFTQNEPLTVGQHAVVQALALPAVRLAVKAQLAVDLLAALPQLTKPESQTQRGNGSRLIRKPAPSRPELNL